MYPFVYARVSDVETAVAQHRAADRAAYLAGGTTLLDLMKLDVERPAQLIDVNRLRPSLEAVEQTPEGLRIGALARNSDVAWNELVRARVPVLSEALLAGASPQLRNMATTGGNLLQRTRCTYFRDTSVVACNKRTPGSGCAALEGHARMHAILGVSDACIAAHPSDMCVALAALDAILVIRGEAGERRVPFGAFHLLPGATPDREHALEKGDFIVAVIIPERALFARSRYVKTRDRASYAFALASAATALSIDGDGVIREARVALGGVATKPWRSIEAETALVGKRANESTFRAAAEIALAPARPRKSNAFKVELAKRTVVRALLATAEEKR